MRTILLSLLAVLMPFFASAQNTRTQESRKAALEKEIAQLQAQLKENSTRSTNALNELTLIRKQVSNRRELVAESEKQIKVIDDSMAVVQAKVGELQDKLDTLGVYYRRLIRGAYKNRDTRIWYTYILASRNLGQASRRYAYLRNLSGQMNRQASKMKDLRSELEVEIERLDSLKVSAERLRVSRQQDLDQLKSEESRSDKLVAQLKKEKTKYQSQLNTKRKQVEALNKEIQRIIAASMASSSKSSKGSTAKKSSSKPIDYTLASEFEKNKGKLPWPADGPVVEKFGRHNHPVYTNLVMPFNNGIGISLAKGTEVKAVFNGEVKSVLTMPGYNKCILVQHGNYFSFYCKLGQVNVKSGDKVKTGQVLGKVDTIDGQSQLHFQVWKEKDPQNPETWLRPR